VLAKKQVNEVIFKRLEKAKGAAAAATEKTAEAEKPAEAEKAVEASAPEAEKKEEVKA
jgi:hypothetical protein